MSFVVSSIVEGVYEQNNIVSSAWVDDSTAELAIITSNVRLKFDLINVS